MKNLIKFFLVSILFNFFCEMFNVKNLYFYKYVSFFVKIVDNAQMCSCVYVCMSSCVHNRAQNSLWLNIKNKRSFPSKNGSRLLITGTCLHYTDCVLCVCVCGSGRGIFLRSTVFLLHH